jgi:CHAT domain-containing protein
MNPLKRFLFTSVPLLIVSISFFFLNFNPDTKPNIPQEVKKILLEAEKKRAQFDFDGAVADFRKAQEAYRKKGMEQEAVALYGRILYIYPETEEAEEDEQCLALIEEAETALSKLSEKEQAPIKKYIDLGKIRYYNIFEHEDKLMALYEQMMKEYNEEKDWDLLAAVINETNMTVMYKEDLDFELYEKLSKDAVRILEEYRPEDLEKEAHLYYYYPYHDFYAYSNEGGRYLVYNDYENALKYHKMSIDKALATEPFFDSLLYSTAYNSIANIYETKGDLDKAREHYEYAISYSQERFPHAFANYYLYVAETYSQQSKHLKALQTFKLALKYNDACDPENDPYTTSRYFNLYRGMAKNYIKIKQLDLAKEQLLKLKELPEEENEFPFDDYMVKALYQHAKGNLAEAKKLYSKAAEMIWEGSHYRAEAYWNIGKIAMEEKSYEEALEYFQKSLIEEVIKFDSEDPLQHPKLAEIENKHDILQFLIDKLAAMRAYAKAENRLEDYAESIFQLTELTVNVFEEVRNSFERESSKRSLLETAFATYELAIATHLDLYNQLQDPKHLETAFALSERNKSVLLMDALQEGEALKFAGVPDSLVSREAELNNNIAFYAQKSFLAEQKGEENNLKLYKKYLFESREELDALKARFEKDFPAYYQLKYKRQDIDLAQLQSSLTEEQAILSYFEGQNELFCFSLTAEDGLKVARYPRDAAYRSAAQQLRELLTNMQAVGQNPEKALRDFKTSSFSFYKKYIASEIPEDAKQLFIITDGMLSYLPFETFITEETEKTNFEGLPYLLHKYQISYHYSAGLWAEQRKRAANTDALSLLAMAASYDEKGEEADISERLRSVRDRLTPIPGTEDEINHLKSLFNGQFYLDKAANEATFREEMQKAGIIHLAMHGVVDSKQPEYSGLVFTENLKNTEDDFLHAYEIKSMDLNAELIVLSACETGFGKYQHGEGVASLGRGFMYAGIPSMVMTLWKLHDQSSVVLIQNFYQHLSQGLAKDEALRQAKIDYLNTYDGAAAHPAFWACFIQLGDNRPIKIQKKTTGFAMPWLWIGGGVLALGAIGFAARRKRAL